MSRKVSSHTCFAGPSVAPDDSRVPSLCKKTVASFSVRVLPAIITGSNLTYIGNAIFL